MEEVEAREAMGIEDATSHLPGLFILALCSIVLSALMRDVIDTNSKSNAAPETVTAQVDQDTVDTTPEQCAAVEAGTVQANQLDLKAVADQIAARLRDDVFFSKRFTCRDQLLRAAFELTPEENYVLQTVHEKTW